MPNGVDLSSNNGRVNWTALAADMDFAWVKATEGRSYVNPSFASDLAQARAAGIAVGAYHYARPDNNNAAAEAQHFLNIYRAQPGDLLPVLDLEVHADLSGAGMTAWASTWIDLVTQGLNAEVVLYSYPYFISGDMGGAGGLKGTKLWYADYYYGKPWKFKYTQQAANFELVCHQYTSSGTAGGVRGRVDLNFAPSMAPILQSKPSRPKPKKKRLPGPAKKPKWFWEALKVYLANRAKGASKSSDG